MSKDVQDDEAELAKNESSALAFFGNSKDALIFTRKEAGFFGKLRVMRHLPCLARSWES